MLLGAKDVEFLDLLPILSDSTLGQLHSGALRLSFYYVDILLLAMIVPDLEDKREINNIFFTSIASSSLILILAVIVTQGMFGLEHVRHINFPVDIYARAIRYPNILERIDVIFVLAWLLTSQARLNGFLYLAVRGLREILNKKLDEKWLVIIMGTLLSLTTLVLLNSSSFNLRRRDLVKIRDPMFLIFIIIIPLITCLVYFFRRKKIQESQKLLKNKGE